VIGHDVAAGLSRYAVPGRVVLIGGGAQGPLYEQALRMHGHEPVVLDGEAVAIAGLTDAATSIWPGIISTAAPSSSPMIVESTHL
ncbi:MAG: 2-dehydro-3-deoxygalactonokinase, partial [Pseudomonadota bacterium]